MVDCWLGVWNVQCRFERNPDGQTITLAFVLITAVASAQTRTIKVLPPPPDVAAAPADAAKTPSGLASKVITPGTGTAHPGQADQVTVHYTGLDDRRQDVRQLGRARQAGDVPLDRVIAGWTEGVQLMVAGEKRRFWIPEALAYKGQRRAGGHAGLRRRADRVHRIADHGAARRQGGAGGRQEDLERPRLQECSRPGPARSTEASSRVTVHYSGWTTDGKLFDSSVLRGEPTTFPLDG